MATQNRPGREAILPISFFKIILKTNLQSLKIPNKFTERYGGGLSNPVFLKPSDGSEWKVYWTKHNGVIWFQKGWKEFAENYSLDHGHLVVFQYEGTSHFDVLILDQSALEIDYPSFGKVDQGDDEESVEILDEWPDQKPKQKSLLLSPPPHKKLRGEKATSSMNWPREARAQEVALTFISNNPFFTLTIRSGDLVKGSKAVPDLKGNIENKDKYVILQIGKRSWEVKLLCYDKPRIFSAGWALFAKENELVAGDVCVFEMINREDLVFKVHVYKGTC